MSKNNRVIVGTIVLLALVPRLAFGYIGPGAGVSAIGTLLALFGAILLAIAGFVWYPIKRIIMRFRKRSKSADQSDKAI